MENKGKFNKADVMLEKEWYKKKILEEIGEIESAWILNEILRFIENIQR